MFLFPGAQQHVRAAVLPYHIGIGLSIIALAFATAGKHASVASMLAILRFLTVTAIFHSDGRAGEALI